ncbi:MAG: N-acetylneuraminic acid mutarotase [Bacteroidetes bacterium]|jgi:hypothetical protein|nr:N-acetylneuraminic acid mutarotase [Bacteroidota bacterium]
MNKKFGLLYCLVLIVSLMTTSCGNSDDDLIGNWVAASTDFAGKVRGYATSFTVGSELYVFGGYNGKTHFQDLWKLDLSSTDGSWTQLADLDSTTATITDATTAHYARKYAVGFSIDTDGYIGCGWNGNDYMKDFWKYDTSTDTWTQIANFPESARYGCYGFSLNSVGYVGGGVNDDGYFNSINSYDPSTASWTTLTGKGKKRAYASAFVISDVAYLFGGLNSSGAPTDMWSFDGTDWVEKREIYNKTDESYDDDYSNIARYNAATFVINGKGYVTCGTSGSGTILKYTWEYNPTNDLWTQKTSFEKTARTGAIGATITTGAGIVVTGASGSTYLDDANFFYPSADYSDND